MGDDEEVTEEVKCPPCEEGAPAWTTTFGDMMSLLLTFFILLFSMSELKMDRFLLAAQSLREAVGGTAEVVIEDPMGLMPDPVDPDLVLENPGSSQGASETQAESQDGVAGGSSAWVDALVDAYMKLIASQLQQFVDDNNLKDLLSVEMSGEGVYLRIQTMALFPSGSSVVADQNSWILDKLADVVRDIEFPVAVSGHADNRPISTPEFASNWELSAARAAGVARALVAHGHDPYQLRVESFGEYRPLADNDTPLGRALNRRVELFYSRQAIAEAVIRMEAEAAALADSAAVADTAAREGGDDSGAAQH